MAGESVAESVSTPAEREVERMTLCQRELEALKNISPEQFERYWTAFSRLMNGAAKYDTERARVNTNIQNAIDVHYPYQVALL